MYYASKGCSSKVDSLRSNKKFTFDYYIQELCICRINLVFIGLRSRKLLFFHIYIPRYSLFPWTYIINRRMHFVQKYFAFKFSAFRIHSTYVYRMILIFQKQTPSYETLVQIIISLLLDVAYI